MLKSKTAPGLLLNRPLTNTKEIIAALRTSIPNEWNVPIYDEFPSDTSKVRYGLYVDTISTISRTVNQLGVQYCGAYYNAEDNFKVIYVSYQQDPYEDEVTDIVSNLVTYENDGVQLFDGYFSRTYSLEIDYGPTRAEIYTWDFNLIRLEFNT
jgi:hypothetical protein